MTHPEGSSRRPDCRGCPDRKAPYFRLLCILGHARIPVSQV